MSTLEDDIARVQAALKQRRREHNAVSKKIKLARASLPAQAVVVALGVAAVFIAIRYALVQSSSALPSTPVTQVSAETFVIASLLIILVPIALFFASPATLRRRFWVLSLLTGLLGASLDMLVASKHRGILSRMLMAKM